MANKKRGRPVFEPSASQRTQVCTGAAKGMSRLQIALAMGISSQAISRHYENEFSRGYAIWAKENPDGVPGQKRGRKVIDMAGERYGRLVVLDRLRSIKKPNGSIVPWRCRCDCGGELLLESSKLRSGARSDCGCVHRENLAKAQAERENARALRQTALGRRPTQDETGKRFGRLTAIEYVILEDGTGRWRCACDCGGQSLSLGTNLRKGSVTSCGCILREKSAARSIRLQEEKIRPRLGRVKKIRDETGNRYGRLLVIEPRSENKYGLCWLCVCDCGAERIAQASILRSGGVRSCGCLKRDISAARAEKYWTEISPVSKKEKTAQDRRKWRSTKPASHAAGKKRRDKRNRDTLHPTYIASVIARHCGCKKSAIPAAAIEAKRLQLSINRFIKENEK